MTDKELDTLSNTLLLLGFALTSIRSWEFYKVNCYILRGRNTAIYIYTCKREDGDSFIRIHCNNYEIYELACINGYRTNKLIESKKEALKTILYLIKECNK